MSRLTKYAVILAVASLFHPTVAKASSNAATTIENFYRGYVKHYTKPDKPYRLIHPSFSQSLRASLKENDRTCKEKAESVCGYGTGDLYLAVSALEVTVDQSRFTFEKANFRFTPLSPHVIQVDFDLPLIPEFGGKTEHRTVIYVMLKEGNQWVIDDIIHIDGNSKHSLRESVWHETVHLLMHPEK